MVSSRDLRAVPHPVWRGELYLELHQGTLTSQAKIKAQNRMCEGLLRALEALHVFCLFAVKKRWVILTEEGNAYLISLSSKILNLWKDTLLNQFHDVIRKFSDETFLILFQRDQVSPRSMWILIDC